LRCRAPERNKIVQAVLERSDSKRGRIQDGAYRGRATGVTELRFSYNESEAFGRFHLDF